MLGKFFFHVGLSQPTAFKVGKFGFFHLPARCSYFWLNYIVRCLRGHFTGIFHNFNQIVYFLFFFFLVLSRVYFTLGGFGGPEKDPVLKVSW